MKATDRIIEAAEDIGEYCSEAAAKAILEAMSWQPIETAPRDGTFIDLWFPHNRLGPSILDERRVTHCRWTQFAGMTEPGWFAQQGGRAYRMGGSAATDPTHWMPLPEPPE